MGRFGVVHEVPDRNGQSLGLRTVTVIEVRAGLAEVSDLLLKVLPESVRPLLPFCHRAVVLSSSSSRSAICSLIRRRRCPEVPIVTSVGQAAPGDTLGDTPLVL